MRKATLPLTPTIRRQLDGSSGFFPDPIDHVMVTAGRPYYGALGRP